MDETQQKYDTRRPATTRLPAWVYKLLVGLAAWFALASWFFAGPSTTDYLLFVVSAFIVVVVSLLLILSRVGRGDIAADDAKSSRAEDQLAFQDGAKWDLDAFQARLTFSQAATQILLPLATAAFGMTAIGIAFHIAEHMRPATGS